MDIVVLQGRLHLLHRARRPGRGAARASCAARGGTRAAFRRVILETTGLADPAPVLFTLAGDPVLRHKFDAGAVIATVDAVHGARQLERHPECRKQIAVADRLVVTKTDMRMRPRWRPDRPRSRGSIPPPRSSTPGLDALELCLGGAALTGAGRCPARGNDAAVEPRAAHTHDVAARRVDVGRADRVVALRGVAEPAAARPWREASCASRPCSTWRDGTARWCSTASIISSIRRSICRPGPKAARLADRHHCPGHST